MEKLTAEKIWSLLEEIKDPEIPVISVVELGLVRSVGVEDGEVIIAMTPTFIGCPALDVMKSEIERQIRQAGAERVQVKVVYSPPWSTEWITTEGREKLKGFGLSPPPRHAGDIDLALLETAACPYCDSQDTSLKNSFGPTACRAIYFCNSCRQPFEQFKPL